MENNSINLGISDQLSKSELIFRKVWESSADGMRITDSEGNMLYVNEAFCKIVGKDKSLLMGQPLYIIYKKETQGEIIRQYKSNHLSEKLQVRPERQIELWNGEIINVELSNSFIRLEGDKRVVLSILRDITERKKMEEELYESQQMLRLILDHIPQGVFWKDINSQYLSCNKHFAEDAGLNHPSEIVGMNDYQLPWKEIANLYRSDDRLVMDTNTPKINYEESETKADGSFICVRTSKVPLNDKEGRVIGILGTYENITERKRAEEKLRMLSFAVEQSRRSYIITDTEGRIEYVNPTFTEIKGYSLEEMIGETPRILRLGETAEDEYSNLWDTVTRGGEWRGEIRNIKKTGESFWEYVIISPIKSEKGEIEHFLLVQEDITEKKQKDEKLLQAVKEKEVMLSEIHNRVNNNLQIISSLLKLQSEYIRDPVAREYFRISQSRVSTMSLIHEQLYKSSELNRINFEKYIRQLTIHLFQTYGMNINQCKMRINAVNIFLGIDIAIPCGLIINELVSNSLKHAFPGNRKGEIYIGLTCDRNNMYTLFVSDNGVGFPANIDFRNAQTLGLKLISTLTKQLQGKLELNTEEGTEFKITFPAVTYKKGM